MTFSPWALWLLVATEIILFSLFWLASAKLQKQQAFRGLYYLAAFNLLIAISFLFIGMRDIWPDYLTRVMVGATSLFAVAMLWHGGALLIQVPTRVEAFVVPSVGSLLILFNHLFASGADTVRENIVFLAIGWMVLRAGWCAWDSLKDGDPHYRRAGLTLMLTGLFAALAALARTVANIVSDQDLNLAQTSLSSYVSALVMLLALTTVNGMLAYALMHSLTRKLEHMALVDALTGLFNRHAFTNHHNQQWRNWLRSQQKYALVCFDIDHFKSINDTYGHAVGDEALVMIAKIISQSARPTDRAVRTGGEEFVLLLDNIQSPQAVKIAERVRKTIAELPPLPAMPQRQITVSAGVAVVDESTTTAQQLLEKADQALYEAKSSGRNKVCLYQNAQETPPLVPTAGTSANL